MKTLSESKFDELVKNSFHKILKPLGFKKKGNNFYLKLGGFGKIVNIQKSIFGDKNEIKFTINIGIFSADFWEEHYNYHDEAVPDYPTEPVCVIRNRIGKFLGTTDKWFSINAETDINSIIHEMEIYLNYIIIPYFDKINTINDVINELSKIKDLQTYLARIIILAKNVRMEEAKQVAKEALKEEKANSKKIILDKVKQLGIMV